MIFMRQTPVDNHYYDSISEGYEELHKEEQLKKVALIREHLTVKKTDKLLDVGCGTGLTTEPWDCERYGIDPSAGLLARARQQDKITYVQASAESIPYPDHFFDVVISVTALQNFSDVEKGLFEIKRVGKCRFVLTFLKRSPKKRIIESAIQKMFHINRRIEEEKDLIFLATTF